jgi:4-hydroxy-3-polyprenylbenzoate decarboxylase
MTPEQSYYKDLREFIQVLENKDKLIRIQKEINKDTELQPLVRWQFRGLEEDDRKAFLFENVTDSKGRKYQGSVLVAGLAGSADIYCLGVQCKPDEITDRWLHAMDHPIEPVLVDSGTVQEEIHTGSDLLSHGGFTEFPIPISTPGFDNGPYITGGHWITKNPETGQRNVGNYRGQEPGNRTAECRQLSWADPRPGAQRTDDWYPPGSVQPLGQMQASRKAS